MSDEQIKHRLLQHLAIVGPSTVKQVHHEMYPFPDFGIARRLLDELVIEGRLRCWDAAYRYFLYG